MYSYSFALQYHRFSAFCPAPVLRRRLWAPLKNLNDTLECSSIGSCLWSTFATSSLPGLGRLVSTNKLGLFSGSNSMKTGGCSFLRSQSVSPGHGRPQRLAADSDGAICMRMLKPKEGHHRVHLGSF